MADFSTEAELSIVVPQRELRSARQEVEDALADIPVGVSASGGGAGSSTTNAAREQRRRRREFRWARRRTNDTEAQLEILENIEGELTTGGFGGDGGGGLGSELIGVGVETAGDAAITTAETAANTLKDVLTGAASTALGNAVSDAVSGATLSVADKKLPVKPNPLPVKLDGLKKPEWVPIQVEGTEEDGFLPDFDDLPTLPLPDSSDLPSLPLPDFLSGGPDPLPIEDPPTLAIEDPPTLEIEDPLMLTVERPEWVPIGVNFSERGSGAGSSGTTASNVRQQDTFNRGIRKVPFIGDILGDADRRLRPSAGGELAFPLPGESPTPGNNPAGQPQSLTASTGAVNITVNADVQSTVQSVVDELRREQERQRQELRDDLERQISDLERQISSGGRGGVTGL